MGELSRTLPLSSLLPHCGPATRRCMHRRLGCSPFARHYWGNRLRFLFLRILRCFTSPGMALTAYEFNRQEPGMTPVGFPHSDIAGSKCACHSPTLIAACYVLPRLPMPRHSPCALSNLTKTLGHSSHNSVKNCMFPSYAIIKEPT